MGGILGPMIGANEAGAARQDASNAQQQALQQWLGVSSPSISDQQLILQQYANAGNLTPQMQQALQMGPTAMGGIQTDPRLVQAQMAALNQLSQTGQTGMSPAEQAALTQAQQQAASMAQAKSAQLMDEFARRGMGGSGNELAARLSNAQSAAQMAGNNSNQIAQNAHQNALQALVQSGQLGGQMQSQQFGQQADIAKARDYINQFNTQNSQQVSNQNVQAANQAALRNLVNQQNLMNQNTQVANEQQQHNQGLLQQQFNNQMGLASGRAGQYQGIAQTNQQNAGRIADMYAGIGQGVDAGIGAAYNAYNRPAPTTRSGGGGQNYTQNDMNDAMELWGGGE